MKRRSEPDWRFRALHGESSTGLAISRFVAGIVDPGWIDNRMESGITDAGYNKSYNKSIPEVVAGIVDPGLDHSANDAGL